MKALLRKLRSLKATVVLLICLAAMFLLGILIPQKSLLGRDLYLKWQQTNPALVSLLEAAGLTDIHTSPVVIALWIVFFLHLILIMTDRIPLIWRRCFRDSIPKTPDSIRSSRQYRRPDHAEQEIISQRLIKKSYRIITKDNSFWAVKNRFSPLATVIFHLSFLLLLFGGVLGFYTKFRGEVGLAVGETFSGGYDSLVRPRVGDIPWARFTVLDIEPGYYEKTVPVSLDVVLQTEQGKKVVGINRPYTEGALSFIVKDIDVAPLFVLSDADGNELDGAYVKLKVLSGREDTFAMGGFVFSMIFYPEFSSSPEHQPTAAPGVPQVMKQLPDDLSPQGRTREIVNPALAVKVFRDGKQLNTATLLKGESVVFDGYRLRFGDLTYWVRFYVVKDYGTFIVIAGFILMTGALIVRFLFPRRDIFGYVEGGVLHLGGRGEFYQVLFEDEFSDITAGADGTDSV